MARNGGLVEPRNSELGCPILLAWSGCWLLRERKAGLFFFFFFFHEDGWLFLPLSGTFLSVLLNERVTAKVTAAIEQMPDTE